MSRILEKKIVYSGKRISLAIYRFKVNAEIFEKEIVLHPGAVVIVPKKGDNFVLVKQYRPAVEDRILEFPAGTLEKGETPEECARRELVEETGYDAAKVKYLGEIIVSPGYTSERIHAFLAEKLVYRGVHREPYEDIENVEISQEELEELIKHNAIKDAKTIAAYFMFKLRL